MNGDWSFPSPVRFGAGRIAELPAACRELGMARPLLITDEELVAAPITASAVARCSEAGLAIDVFSSVRPHPTGADVAAGVGALRRGAHDGVIGFGGGSALDVAKGVGLMAGQTLPIWDFVHEGPGRLRADERGIVPVVAVPTAAGTGSEVSPVSILLDPSLQAKRRVMHPRMVPGRVICDPELTLGLDAATTAATGMDALCHCLEAYCATGLHPMADGIAAEALRLIAVALPRAFADGDDLEARADMLCAALMGGAAGEKGRGAVHALSHPIGARLAASHGLTNAVLLPYVLRHNAPAIRPRLERLARYLDLPKPSFEGFLDWILSLREKIGIPHTALALGLDTALCDELAPLALRDPAATTNPVPLDLASAASIYRRALEGDLT